MNQKGWTMVLACHGELRNYYKCENDIKRLQTRMTTNANKKLHTHRIRRLS